MATKKRTMPYHVMPDGTTMPGATHEAYMAQEATAKPKGGKKAVKMGQGKPQMGNPFSMKQEPLGDILLGKGKPVKKAPPKKGGKKGKK